MQSLANNQGVRYMNEISWGSCSLYWRLQPYGATRVKLINSLKYSRAMHCDTRHRLSHSTANYMCHFSVLVIKLHNSSSLSSLSSSSLWPTFSLIWSGGVCVCVCGGKAIDHGQTFAYVFHSVIRMMMQSSNPAISAFDSSLRIRA